MKENTHVLLKIFIIILIILIMIPINSFVIAWQRSDEQIFRKITTFNDDLIHTFEAYYNVDFPNDVKFLKAQDKPEGLHDNRYYLYIQVNTSQVADLILNSGDNIERNYVVKNEKNGITKLEFSKRIGININDINESKIGKYFSENSHPAITPMENLLKVIEINIIPFFVVLLIIFGNKIIIIFKKLFKK